MKAIRKSDGKVIEVDSTPYFSMKTDEEYRRCLYDGKHYELSELDFSVNETKESEAHVSVAKLREILITLAEKDTITNTQAIMIINQVKKSI